MSKTKKVAPRESQPAKSNVKASTKPLLTNVQFAMLVTGIFYLLSLIGALVFHEPWRDEYQAFLVAKHSSNLSELFYNMKYEGHPPLFHMLMFALSHAFDSMVAVKIFHSTVAAVTVFLICRFLPLKWWQKIALCFGYYLFYEYNMIVRTYAVGIMLLTLAVVIYRLRYIPQLSSSNENRSVGYVLGLTVALFLLSLTSVIGIAMCGCMLALMASDALVLLREKKFDTNALERYVIPTVASMIGMAICYVFIKPEPDSTFPMHYTSGWATDSFQNALGKMFSNLVMLIPFNEVAFWNKHAFIAGTFTWLPWFGLITLVIATLYFLSNNRLLLFYMCAAVAMFGFVYLTNMSQVRYSGHWFVLFALAYALSLDYKNQKQLFAFSTFRNGVNTATAALFNIALVVGLISGLGAYAKDASQPFSNTDAAGRFLLEQHWDRYAMVGATDFVVSPITYHTKKPIRLAESKRTGYFIRWNKDRAEGKLGFPDVITEIQAVMKEGNDTVLVILDTPLRFVVNGQTVEFTEDDLYGTDIHLKRVKDVAEPCIVEDELYYFYFATRNK